MNPRSWFSTTLRAAWTINLLLLLLALYWVGCEGTAPQTPSALWASLDTGKRYLLWAVVFAVGSLLGVMLGLVVGPKACRSLRSWLLAVGLVCCWCGLGASWTTLYWQGQKLRIGSQLPIAENLIVLLNANWPDEDAELEQLGYCLAYPKQSVATLLFLSAKPVSDSELCIAAIERPRPQVMVLELAGAEVGAWLEWHGDGTEPTSFVGGLQTNYELQRFSQLREGWYLVRYQTAPPTGTRQLFAHAK